MKENVAPGQRLDGCGVYQIIIVCRRRGKAQWARSGTFPTVHCALPTLSWAENKMAQNACSEIYMSLSTKLCSPKLTSVSSRHVSLRLELELERFFYEGLSLAVSSCAHTQSLHNFSGNPASLPWQSAKRWGSKKTKVSYKIFSVFLSEKQKLSLTQQKKKTTATWRHLGLAGYKLPTARWWLSEITKRGCWVVWGRGREMRV